MEKQECPLSKAIVYLQSGIKGVHYYMRKSVHLIIFLVVSITAIGQGGKKDSLIKLLNTAKKDSSAVAVYMQLVMLYEDSEPAKAIHYCRMAETLSRKINYDPGIYKAMSYLGSLFVTTSKFDSALYCYKQCLKVAQKQNDSLNIGVSLFNIGSTYRYLDDLQSALDYSLQAVKAIEASDNKRLLVQMNNGLQLLYYSLPNFPMAISYGEKAVRQSRELKDDNLLLMCLSNLCMAYKDSKLLGKARAGLMESLRLAEQAGNIYARSAIYLNLAGVFHKLSDYGLMKKYAEQALMLYRQIGEAEGEGVALRALAIVHLQEGNYQLAKDLTQQAYAIADSNNFRLDKADCLKMLAQVAFAMQDLRTGDILSNKGQELAEEIMRESYLKTAAEYEKKYESGKKDEQILLQNAQLAKRKFFNYILAGSVITLLLISFLFYRNYQQKQKLQEQRISELEKEKQLSAAQAVLKGEEQERTRLAKDLHDGLGGMMSGIKYSLQTMKRNQIMTPENQLAFERSMEMLDSSINEMRRVAHNMMPEALVKFGLDVALKDFCNDINTSGALVINCQSIGVADAAIEQSTAITIYRIVQELVNNTMKHAAAKTAIVQITKTNDVIAITVEDDGKGFDPVILNASKGIGWTNIQSRISYLKGRSDVKSEPGKGTSVHIELSI
jgi:two-component system NarL family sensor kinase